VIGKTLRVYSDLLDAPRLDVGVANQSERRA